LGCHSHEGSIVRAFGECWSPNQSSEEFIVCQDGSALVFVLLSVIGIGTVSKRLGLWADEWMDFIATAGVEDQLGALLLKVYELPSVALRH
jgi:hypothetical protein